MIAGLRDRHLETRAGQTPGEGHDPALARILLIEDDDRIRETTRQVLEGEGYEVDEAASAERGLLMFGQRSPDCAVVDLMLPGINGFECCSALRRSSDIPIVVLSAGTDSHDLVASLEKVWGDPGAGDTRVLDMHIHRVRNKLEEDPTAPAHMLTVPGLGYQLV